MTYKKYTFSDLKIGKINKKGRLGKNAKFSPKTMEYDTLKALYMVGEGGCAQIKLFPAVFTIWISIL